MSYAEELVSRFANDSLYKLIKSINQEDKIINDNMNRKLRAGYDFTIDDVCSMLQIKSEILRNLLNGANSEKIPKYIKPSKEKRKWHINCEDVIRIRMVFMIHEELDYSYNQIAVIGIQGKPAFSVSDDISFSKIVEYLRLLTEEISKQNTIQAERNNILLEIRNYLVDSRKGKLQKSPKNRTLADLFRNYDGHYHCNKEWNTGAPVGKEEI